MDIRDTKKWPALAGQRLAQAPQAGRICRIYTGIVLGLSLAVALILWGLDLAMAQTSGLGDMGKRSLLATVQTILPMGQSLFLLCLDLGFLAAMLRVSRGQYVSPQTLRLGFDRFWVLLRALALQVLLYLLVGIPLAYLTLAVYILTPLGQSVVEALMPMMTAASLTDELYAQAAQALEPCLMVCMAVTALVICILSYRYRMVNYILIDKPGTGAWAALRQSRIMMKGRCRKLFRLDLRLWWYYAAVALATLAGELDRILPRLGISLPWSGDVCYYISYFLSLALMGLTYLFLRGKAEVTLAFAYDAGRPKEADSGVVLGNIFQM